METKIKRISEVYNMDCLEYMKALPDKHFDLCIADPPYGLGDKLVIGGTWSKKYQTHGVKWDTLLSKDYFDQIFRVSKNWIIWGGNYYLEYMPNCRCFICWNKPYMSGMKTMSNCELALTSFDANARCIDINRENVDRIHVTQKPIALYSWVLDNYAKEGDKIFDPFLGSGSSRIAAYMKGFDFYACELDKDYYEAQEERFKRECLGEYKRKDGSIVKQLTLFE